MIWLASAKCENLFITANFEGARAQLSKLEHQWALPPNSGKIMKKQLFIFPNSPTIHHTSTLHNIFYFNNTWTKTQLWSDPVNMQPDKAKCHPQRVTKTHYNVWPARCRVHLAEAPPLNIGTLSLYMLALLQLHHHRLQHLASIDCPDNCKMRREIFKFWFGDLVHLISEIWR